MLSMGIEEAPKEEKLDEEDLKVISKDEFNDQCKEYLSKVLTIVTGQARLSAQDRSISHGLALKMVGKIIT